MERSEILAHMGELKLHGMKSAFDQIVGAAVKRQHEPQRALHGADCCEASGRGSGIHYPR